MRAHNMCDNDDNDEGVSIGIVTHGRITLNDCSKAYRSLPYNPFNYLKKIFF